MIKNRIRGLFRTSLFQKEFQPSGTPTRELSSRWSGFSTLRESFSGLEPCTATLGGGCG